jgi:hypothetical protein
LTLTDIPHICVGAQTHWQLLFPTAREQPGATVTSVRQGKLNPHQFRSSLWSYSTEALCVVVIWSPIAVWMIRAPYVLIPRCLKSCTIFLELLLRSRQFENVSIAYKISIHSKGLAYSAGILPKLLVVCRKYVVFQ